MKRKLRRPMERFVGLLFLVLYLAAPRAALAIGMDGSCDIGNISGDCTISTEHEITSNLTIEGNLIVTPTGHLRFTGTDSRQLYVKGGLDVQVDGLIMGKISYEGTGVASPGQNGGILTIIVDGHAMVSGEVSAKGGNGQPGSTGAPGGNGGALTFNVCGDFISTGDITAKGGTGGAGTGMGGVPGPGGNGGTILINVNGAVAMTSGDVNAQGGTGPGAAVDGADGAITINTAASDANTVGAIFNPVPTINLNQDDPAQCSQPVPEGCGLGYWKNHLVAWGLTGYLPSDTVGSMFSNAPASLSGVSLINALNFKGGSTLDAAKQILLRQAVAAVLNAAHPDVFYPRSEQSVMDEVNAQLAGSNRGDILSLSEELDLDNNLGCPLN